MTPTLPYTRPRTKEGFFRKHEYVYDEYFDCLTVTFAQQVKSNKEGYREYKSSKQICATCPFLAHCTESKDHQKVVTRYIWQEYVEEADHHRHHKDVKPIYAKRKETIERVFADVKKNMACVGQH
jgi:hypothetical protein